MLLFLLSIIVTGSTAASEPSFERRLAALAQAVPALPGQEEQRRTALLVKAADTSRPESERVEAIKELRAWTPRDKAVGAVLEGFAKDPKERLSVRLRALKSLGTAITLPGSQFQDTLAVLLGIARDGGKPVAVRAMAVKALHWANSSQAWVRREMLDWAGTGSPIEIREAAIWALASASAEVAGELRVVLDDRSQETRLRAAATKALDEVSRDEIWTFFRLRYDPIGQKMIEVLELE